LLLFVAYDVGLCAISLEADIVKNLTLITKVYILSAVFIGGVLGIWQIMRVNWSGIVLLLIASALTAIAQVIKVEGPTPRTNYNISLLFYGFALFSLGAPAALFVIFIACVVEWTWHKYPWYIQSFNMGALAIAMTFASLVYSFIVPQGHPIDLQGAVGILVALVIFTFLNHLLVGIVIILARGESFSESGIFDPFPLIMDATLMAMGAGAAIIWSVNPYAALLALIPLYLIYSTIKVPSLQRQAQTDSKTKLFNADYFTRSLESELARADRFDRPLTVVMGDLDFLRNINNSYGHLAGDEVLIGIAKILQNSIREYDVVARFGGEEFCLLMPETTPHDALQRIEGLRATIEAAEFEVPTSVTPVKITMSFGIAGRTGFGETAKDLLHSADLGVYQAKANGRNRICIYSTDGSTFLSGNRTFTSSTDTPIDQIIHQRDEVKTTSPETAAGESSQTKKPPARNLRSHPGWAINAYIAFMLVTASLVLWLTFRIPATLDWLGLLIFTCVAVLAEMLSIDIYIRDTSVSTSAAPYIAVMFLYGPIGVIVTGLAMSSAAFIKHRSPLNRFVFNSSAHLIPGLLCASLILFLTRVGLAQYFIEKLAIVIICGGILYLSTSFFVSGAIYLSSDEPFWEIWSERFRWLVLYYLAMGILSFSLIITYEYAKLIGVLVILVPLLLLRLSQMQYIEHTKSLVNQLRGTNLELRKKAEEISSLNEELLVALSNIIDLRDPYVMGHSQNVARYATLIAREMNLPPERVELIRKAGLLHDIGKIGIPEFILFKPDRLNNKEFAVVKEHVTLGTDILNTCHSLRGLIPLIGHHHEHYDGSGYPDGMKGQEPPIEARILCVADAVEAMASDRPYRKGLACQEILAELFANAGTQFDPQVVNAFSKVIKREGETVIINSALSLQTDLTRPIHYAARAKAIRDFFVQLTNQTVQGPD
jgi:diguanylate cyclase (GGDEF)-like protein/putative nucleotidyltransferase with HDIG domain